MQDLNYRIILKPEPEGGFTVTVPALPGCVTYGETLEQARVMAQDAIQGYLASMEKHAEPFTDDTDTFESQLTVHYA